MPTLTAKQVTALKLAGRVIGVYPRKGIICVDGFKYFRVDAAALAAAKAA